MYGLLALLRNLIDLEVVTWTHLALEWRSC